MCVTELDNRMDTAKRQNLGSVCLPLTLMFSMFFLLLTLISFSTATPVPKEIPTSDISQQWELIKSVDEENLKVEKYRSKRTNLTVILGPSETPIVNGYFCLATEAFDNDGLPHTLEHLIFRGSEDYPYKEMLDNLATR